MQALFLRYVLSTRSEADAGTNKTKQKQLHMDTVNVLVLPSISARDLTGLKQRFKTWLPQKEQLGMCDAFQRFVTELYFSIYKIHKNMLFLLNFSPRYQYIS